MKQTIMLCNRCAADLKDAGYSVTQITTWRRVNCGHCGRRDTGAAYHIRKGEKK